MFELHLLALLFLLPPREVQVQHKERGRLPPGVEVDYGTSTASSFLLRELGVRDQPVANHLPLASCLMAFTYELIACPKTLNAGSTHLSHQFAVDVHAHDNSVVSCNQVRPLERDRKLRDHEKQSASGDALILRGVKDQHIFSYIVEKSARRHLPQPTCFSETALINYATF